MQTPPRDRAWLWSLILFGTIGVAATIRHKPSFHLLTASAALVVRGGGLSLLDEPNPFYRSVLSCFVGLTVIQQPRIATVVILWKLLN